jgi:hypothetical protein
MQAAGGGVRRPAAATGGGTRRRDPNPGLRGTVRCAGGIYTTRAGQRIHLGRRPWQRCDGAGGRRGGADHELWRGS